jgi:hypothetical protein
VFGGTILAFFAVLTEIFFEGELGEEKGNFTRSAALQVVERVNASFADDWRIFGLSGNVSGREGQLRVIVERVVERFAFDVVTVANQSREGNFASNTVFEGSNPRGNWTRLGVFG